MRARNWMPSPHFLVLIALFGILGVFTFFVFDKLSNYEPETRESEGWKPPAIPQCDKELWERIKDGCNES